MNREVWRMALQYRVPATPLARRTIGGAGIYAIVQGAGIILGGPGRWGSDTYAVLRQAPGGSLAWGWMAVVVGILILYGHCLRNWTVKSAGMLLLTIWSVAFAFGAARAALIYPGAGTTAWAVYALVAYWTAVLIWVDEGTTDHASATDHPGQRLGRPPR